MKQLKCENLFIGIINTKLYNFYIISTCDELHNFGKTKWLDNFGHHLY
jgi:hypothetical protein